MLKFEWKDGEVGDYRLTVGLKANVAHVYQNPWNKGVWVVEAQAFGLDKMTFGSLASATIAAEHAIEEWIDAATFKPIAPAALTWSLKSG